MLEWAPLGLTGHYLLWANLALLPVRRFRPRRPRRLQYGLLLAAAGALSLPVDGLPLLGYQAAFLGIGCTDPAALTRSTDGSSINGTDLTGVLLGLDFLREVKLGRGATLSGKTVVIGGGNVAIDVAMTARRQGASEVEIVCLESREEMPARAEEVDHAMEEGVRFHFLCNPVKIIGDDNGRVSAMECLRYELGEPDDSGRRRPVAVKGSEFEIDVDTVIPAIGNLSNPLIRQTTPELVVNERGNIVVALERTAHRVDIIRR